MSVVTISLPLGIGIAGLGRMGTYHLERLGLRDDCRVVGAFDIDSETAAPTASGFGCSFTNNWQSFLADAEIDVVFICTPPAEHAQMAIESLNAGKHVVVETPFCLTTADADLMIATANRTGCMLSIAHNRRWDDDFRTAQTALQAGTLGELQAVKHIVYNYRLQESSLANADCPNDSEQGKGVLWEFGVHLFDQLLELVKSQPVSIFARLDDADAISVNNDWFLAIINFANGVTAQIEVNLVSSTTLNTGWLLSGTRGGYRNFNTSTITDDGEIYETPTDPIPTDWDQFYTGVVGHLREASELPVTAEQARKAVRLIEACQSSARSGKVIHFAEVDC